MAWAEGSFATSPAHEALLDALHGVFHRPAAGDRATTAGTPRASPWLPHLSLCYDNPEGFGPNLTLSAVKDLLREECPTLAKVLDRNGGGVVRTVSGISLWKTAGTMADWRCLDRFEFPSGREA